MIIFLSRLSYWMCAEVTCTDATREGLAERGNIILMAGTGCFVYAVVYVYVSFELWKPISQVE